MTQKKVDIQRIANDKTRIITYKKRKACLYKKAEEFSTLCGVDTCLIVYGPTKATDEVVSKPEIWPKNETKVRDIIERYRGTVSNSSKKENHVETFVNDLGKAKAIMENDNIKRMKSSNKYCSWEKKLDRCSQEQLRGILFAVNNKLHEAIMRQDYSRVRAHYQTMETSYPQIYMDQQYMPQYFSEHQQQYPGLMSPNNNGFSFISPNDGQIHMDANTNLGLTQGLMMSTGNDDTQFMQRQAPYNANYEPTVQGASVFDVIHP